MAKVIGVGGIFFRSRDPAALAAWYREHLGVALEDWGGARYEEDATRPGSMVWAPFAHDTPYFGSSGQAFMVNFRVDDLDGLLARLRQAGVEVEPRIEDSEFGRFGWIVDPEGMRVELWQPPADGGAGA